MHIAIMQRFASRRRNNSAILHCKIMLQSLRNSQRIAALVGGRGRDAARRRRPPAMTESAKVITMPAHGGKDLYEIGEIPPVGHVPSKMYAWAIRRERHGEPEKAMQVEV